MSDNAPTHYGQAFDDKVIHDYQRTRRLRHTVRTKMVDDAKDLTFRRVGTGTATTRARGGTVTLNSASKANVTVTPVEVNATEFVDRQDVKRMGYDDRDVLSQSNALALARKADNQIIVKAAADSTNTVINRGTEFAKLQHLLLAITALQDNDVPDDGEMFFICPPKVFNSFMLFEQFSSADYVGEDGMALKEGDKRTNAKNWNGLTLISHTDCPLSGASDIVADCLMWHKSAMGHGTIDEIETDVTKTNATGKLGWNVMAIMDMDAVVINGAGVQKVQIKNAFNE